MSTDPKRPAGRALTDEVELSDEELDLVIGGAGPGVGKADENDGWSQIVDDHSKEIPVASPPAGATGHAGKPRDRKTP